MRRIMYLGVACTWLACCGVDSQFARLDEEAPATGAALATVESQPAVLVTPHGYIIHGVDITRDQLAKWAPVVTFHPQERYLPCSIDDALRDATLVDAAGRVLQQHILQTDLRRAPSVGNRVILQPATYGGAPLDAHHQVQAPMYVNAQVPQDASFVDLNYIFLMAFNGPQSSRLKLFGGSTELSLPNFAHHQGDIEGITVRVTPDFQKVIFVRFESHGHSLYVRPDQARFVGTHVAVLSSLNSHASYNAQDFPNHQQHVEARVSALGFGIDVLDITDSAGPTWMPFAVDAQGQSHDIGKLRFVGLDEKHKPVGDQAWAAFGGRLGDIWENAFVGAQRLDGSTPNLMVRACANGLVHTAIALGKTRAFTYATGPMGPAIRRSTQVTAPNWTPPPQF